MENLLTFEQVLASVVGGSDLSSEEEESDHDERRIFCYPSGWIAEAGVVDGGEDFQEEDDSHLG